MKKKMTKTKQINPQSFKKLWKNKKATENIEPILLDIVKEYRPKYNKQKHCITRKDIADRVFSEYVRLYYADDYGYVTCITSGVKVFRKDSQNGHFISRGVLKYRYDIINCHPQTYVENVILSGHYTVYTIKMIHMYGQDKVEEMINDKELVNYNQSWYEEHIVERYKFIQEKKEIINKNKKTIGDNGIARE